MTCLKRCKTMFPLPKSDSTVSICQATPKTCTCSKPLLECRKSPRSRKQTRISNPMCARFPYRPKIYSNEKHRPQHIEGKHCTLLVSRRGRGPWCFVRFGRSGLGPARVRVSRPRRGDVASGSVTGSPLVVLLLLASVPVVPAAPRVP